MWDRIRDVPAYLATGLVISLILLGVLALGIAIVCKAQYEELVAYMSQPQPPSSRHQVPEELPEPGPHYSTDSLAQCAVVTCVLLTSWWVFS